MCVCVCACVCVCVRVCACVCGGGGPIDKCISFCHSQAQYVFCPHEIYIYVWPINSCLLLKLKIFSGNPKIFCDQWSHGPIHFPPLVLSKMPSRILYCLYDKLTSYVSRVLVKSRLILSCINGSNICFHHLLCSLVVSSQV